MNIPLEVQALVVILMLLVMDTAALFIITKAKATAARLTRQHSRGVFVGGSYVTRDGRVRSIGGGY